MEHRGRFQAQGPNKGLSIELSTRWDSDMPPTPQIGHALLDQLHLQLSNAEQYLRELGFTQAHAFVERSADAGGVQAVVRKSYPTPVRKDGRRVDVEVLPGMAFTRA